MRHKSNIASARSTKQKTLDICPAFFVLYRFAVLKLDALHVLGIVIADSMFGSGFGQLLLEKKHMSLAVQVNADGATVLDVRRTLSAIGLHPWSHSGIVAYMAAERAKYRPNIWYYVGRPMKEFLMTIAVVSFLAAAGGGVLLLADVVGIGFTSIFYTHTWLPSADWLLAEVACLVGGALLCWWVFDLNDRITLNKIRLRVRYPAEWLAFPAEKFTGLVPPMMAGIVDKAKSLFPDARFTIHNLLQNERDLDPVLFVEVDTETVALLVWSADGTIVLPR